MTYSEMLKHPKWQEKRLRILERSQFMCDVCSETEKTLSVHHGYYEKGRKPWEYPDESLHCLCEDCHREIGELMARIKRELGKVYPGDLESVLGYICGTTLVPASDAAFIIDGSDFSNGVCDAFRVEHESATDIASSNNSDGIVSVEQLRDLRVSQRRAIRKK